MEKVLHYVSIMNHAGEETFLMNVFRNLDRNVVSFDFLCCMDQEGDYDNEIYKLGGLIRHIELSKWRSPFKRLHNVYLLKKELDMCSRQYITFHIHTQHAMDAVLDAMAAKWAGFKNVIVHSHSTSTLHHLKAHYLFRPLLRRMLVRRFACSQAAGEWLYGRKAGFQIIHNGVDTKIFCFHSEDREKIRRELNVENKLVIGHVGSFTYPKNHEFLINIFFEITKTVSNAVLVLAGAGPFLEKIKAIVGQRQLEDRVIFLGNRSDINLLCQGFDVFLFPSLYEGLPVSVVEAQSTGAPCIVSDSITKEVIVTDLVTMVDLQSSASEWANIVLHKVKYHNNRRSMENEIADAGYDIKEVARELTRIYLSMNK